MRTKRNSVTKSRPTEAYSATPWWCCLERGLRPWPMQNPVAVSMILSWLSSTFPFNSAGFWASPCRRDAMETFVLGRLQTSSPFSPSAAGQLPQKYSYSFWSMRTQRGPSSAASVGKCFHLHKACESQARQHKEDIRPVVSGWGHVGYFL